MNKIFRHYPGTIKNIRRYWSAYGGWGAVFTSPFFHCSVIIALFAWPSWYHSNVSELALSVLPNFLGFTMGGYALWLAVGDDKFKAIISIERPGRASAFMGINAVFVHLIVVQVITLSLSFIYNTQPLVEVACAIRGYWAESGFPVDTVLVIIRRMYSFALTTLFVYSFFAALAVTLAVFRVAFWYKNYLLSKLKKDKRKTSQK